MTYTPNGKPRNAADEIANARAYAAEEAKHPAIRAAMVRDAKYLWAPAFRRTEKAAMTMKNLDEAKALLDDYWQRMNVQLDKVARVHPEPGSPLALAADEAKERFKEAEAALLVLINKAEDAPKYGFEMREEGPGAAFWIIVAAVTVAMIVAAVVMP